MSDAWLNIRFGTYHLMWRYGKLWPSFSENPYHVAARDEDPDWKWFEFYELWRPWR